MAGWYVVGGRAYFVERSDHEPFGMKLVEKTLDVPYQCIHVVSK